MLRLSQRAWNNVLIFAMIGLIVVLNFDRFRGTDDKTARLLVPEGEYILSMQINQVQIEKAGMVWRIASNGMQPETMPSADQLSSIVSAWQQTYIEPSGIEFDANTFADPELIVTLSLAGKTMPTVVALKLIDQNLYFVINKEVFILLSPSIQSLLEPIISVKQ